MKEQLLLALQKAASAAGIEAISVAAIALDFPENPSHGDFTTNVAMVNAKKLGVSPKALAEKIVAEFEKVAQVGKASSAVKSVSIAGPGFINFTLTAEAISKNTQKTLVGSKGSAAFSQIPQIGAGKKILVEYSSPNIAKPFTVGHLRSTIIGDAIARILSALGYSVIRDNHLGDWGTQFGKLLVAIEKWGNIALIEKSEDPIKKLVDLYVKFHDEVERLEKAGDTKSKSATSALEESARAKFQALEAGKDQKIIDTWRTCIDLSKKEFDKIYQRLGVKFDPKRGDTELGESFYVTADKIQPVMEALKSKKLLKDSEGAKVVFFGSSDPKKWTMPPLIIEKSDGTSIYATRDLAADLYRLNTYGRAEKSGKAGALTIVNEVGSEQTLYFRQLIETEKMLGWFAQGERIHIAHGLYRFKEGKMSTRKGNVIWLEDILDEAVTRAAKINADSANDVAIAAIKFNDLRRDSLQDIVFDWDEMMNMTGDSGPYLQYSCVRAKSVIEKAKGLGIVADASGASGGMRPEIPQLDLLERHLLRFPHIVEFSGASYKPNIIANYLIDLAGLFNSFYSQVVIADLGEGAAYKVAVTQAFVNVMGNGLDLLGIKVPERM